MTVIYFIKTNGGASSGEPKSVIGVAGAPASIADARGGVYEMARS
jgi:hypothetical protein